MVVFDWKDVLQVDEWERGALHQHEFILCLVLVSEHLLCVPYYVFTSMNF